MQRSNSILAGLDGFHQVFGTNDIGTSGGRFIGLRATGETRPRGRFCRVPFGSDTSATHHLVRMARVNAPGSSRSQRFRQIFAVAFALIRLTASSTLRFALPAKAFAGGFYAFCNFSHWITLSPQYRSTGLTRR